MVLKQNAFVTEWELAYHKSYSDITILEETDGTTLNKELRSKNMKEYYEAVKHVLYFLNEIGNPYKMVGPVNLHYFISKQVVPSNK